MGLRSAREAARATRSAVRAGSDPIAERRRARALGEAANRGDGTLVALLDAYEGAVGIEQRSWPHSRKRIERVLSGLLRQPLANLTAADVLLAADA